jgi:hypothetical protein
MNCKDFRDIADTYLSDELLVETNHEVFQHLENCADCRQELSMRREVREKLRISFKSATDFQMSAVFANKLRANLKDQVFRQTPWLNWKILTPVLTGLLIVCGLTFILFYLPGQTGYAAEISRKALNRHEDCGLKHSKEWKENATTIPEEKITLVKSLQDGETRVLSVHDCQIEGKRFTHYILERNGKLISVLKTASENAVPANSNEEDSIICKKEHGMQMSSFKIGDDLVFVISDLSEAENLSLARTLFDSIKA